MHIRILYKENIPVNAVINDKLIHSRFHPQTEAKRQFRDFHSRISSSTSSIILYKVGLGYIIDEILLNTSFSLYWFEPLAEVQDAALIRLHHAIPEFEKQFKHRIHIIKIPLPEFITSIQNTIAHFELYYLKTYLEKKDILAMDLFYRKKFYHQVNLNTLLKFEQLWISNFYKNLIFYKNFYPVDLLKGILSKKPLLIVAGGPSLDNWIDTIYGVRDTVWILSVDTAVGSLVRKGIIPDFIISVDAQLVNYFHLEKHLDLDSFFILDVTTYYKSFQRLANNKKIIFVYENSLPFSGYFLKRIFGSQVATLRSGGSVSTTALDLASYLDADPVFLCGLDLSFPQRLTHTKNSAIETRFLYRTGRLMSLEFLNYKQITSLPRRYCYDHNEKPVLTNDKLLIFKNWFEKNHKQYESKQIYILYGNGCKIANFRIITEKKDFLEKINSNTEKKSLPVTLNTRKNSIKEIFLSTIQNLSSIEEKILNILSILQEQKITGEIPLEKIHHEENLILTFEEIKLLHLKNTPLYDTPYSMEEHLELTKNLYLSLLDEIQKNKQSLQKALSMLHNIEARSQ